MEKVKNKSFKFVLPEAHIGGLEKGKIYLIKSEKIQMKNKLCSKCVGATNVMIPKTNGRKGFEYQTCTLCNGTGVISEEIEEDFLLSINENLIDDYD